MIPTIFLVRVDRKRFSFEPTKIYEMKHLYLTLGLIGAQFLSNAQCQLGEIELNMHLYTDACEGSFGITPERSATGYVDP
jgi:hypothetical protein